MAVANALANQEIRKLRDQLEQENIVLREQLCQVQKFDEIVGVSPPIRRVLDAVEQVAVTGASRGRVSGPTGAASTLGLAPSTLEFRIKRLGIDKFRFRANGA